MMTTSAHVCVKCRANEWDVANGLMSPEDPDLARTVRAIDPRSTARAKTKPLCNTHEREEIKRRGEVRRNGHQKRTYGLTADERQQLWDEQNRACLCGKLTSRTPHPKAHTDHDHRLAREHDHPDNRACRACVRGLLCHDCNVVLVGRYNPTRLRAVADYMALPPVVALGWRDEG